MMDRKLAGCPLCGQVQAREHPRCQCCGQPLHPRRMPNLQYCWALLVTGLIFYLPANLLPIMRTTQFGGTDYNTIASGVVVLWEHGSYLIAGIIFVASLLIPLAKFVVLAVLALSQQFQGVLSPRNATRLYRLTEFVGRWSMVDVFVVGFLAALIQMGNLMSIHPGPAALAFGAMVVATMLAANSLDPRVFWEQGEAGHAERA